MILRLLRLCLAVCLTAGALRAQTPAAAPAAPPDDLVGPIKMPDADIDTVLGALSLYTGREILRPQQLQTASYHLVIDRKLPKSEAIQALETILALNGISVSPLGDKFLKVVNLAAVRVEAPEMILDAASDHLPSGKVATKVFQLDFLRVAEFVPMIQGLMNPNMGGPVALVQANALLITDSISNLQRIEALLRQLDKPATTGLTPKFYTLTNGAKPSDLVNKLRAMFTGPLQQQLGSSTVYSADDRSNQVILLADPRLHPIFDELIARLDVKADPNTRIEVFYLAHASAKEVAPILSQLVSGQNAKAQQAGANATARTGPLPAVQPGQPVAATAAALGAALAGDGTGEFSTLITIQFDDRSNSIIVSGTVDDMRLIRELVGKIDIILAQVSIEVIIAEVSLSDTDRSGISALNLTIGPNKATGATQITNFTGAVAGWTVSAGVVNPASLAAALTDAGTRAKVNILSAPTITTTHNKEAEFISGVSQPIITGSQSTPISSTSANSTGFATNSQVTYKDIAIDLKVTPLIGEDGNIQLKIDQKVDDILGNVTIDGNQQPIIGRRQATSFLNVFDGQMIVLGGLQRTKNSNDRSKLGLLHEIPILSHLFGARTVTTERTELLLFIRPTVIRPTDGRKETEKTINNLSNKEQINAFLKDPAKPAKESIVERLK